MFQERARQAIIAIALLVPVFACAQSIPSDWRARYRKLEAAICSRDIKQVEPFCGKDLVWVTSDGIKKNRNDLLAEFKQLFSATKITGHEKVLKLTKRATTVEASCELDFTFVFPGKSDMKYHALCVDTWKKEKGRWVIVRTVDKVVQVTGGTDK